MNSLMNYSIESSASFDKEAKRLGKRYVSFKEDYLKLLDELSRNPQLGTDLGHGLRKVRMKITAKGKGKSGGARVITLTVLISETDTNIVLLTIYDKSECENLTDKELTDIVKKSSL